MASSSASQGVTREMIDKLLNAIDSASFERVQTVLREVCLESSEAFNLARKKRLIDDGNASVTEADRLKRKHESMQQRIEICVQCEEEYDNTNNPKDACRWHSGDMEPDYESDVWAGHDEDCHGPIEDQEDAVPEGFVWNCCDKKGNKKGCEIGEHEPDLGKRVRRGA